MLGISVQSNAVESAAQADALLEKLHAGGVTEIFYYPFQGGAHCKSSYFTASTSMRSGFDSVTYLIEHAHALGMRVHAWFAFGAAIYTLDSAYAIPGGGFTDFSNAEAREAMRSIIAEMVANYPELDGAIFDYMRYPAHEAYSYYSEDDVTQAIESCANEIPTSKDIFTSVKAYYNNTTEWGQRWDLWYADGLVDYIVPMCYSPFAYDDFARSITWWTETAGVPRSCIMPELSVIDTTSENEASYKTAAAWNKELAYWPSFYFSHLAVFDQRATAEHLRDVSAMLPEDEGENGMGIYDTLIEQADALAAAGGDLLERAEVIRAQALALRGADTAADIAVTEAQQALDAAQAVADTF